MRKILLSSSQVSVLLSAAIIFLCTLALFLSGYVIQQRTLRELRAAVRPRQPRPKPASLTYLPDHFKPPATDKTGEENSGGDSLANSIAEKDPSEQTGAVVIEVTETAAQPPQAPLQAPPSRADVSSKKLAMLESLQKHAAQKTWAVENPDPLSKSHVPISRAERRRLIKAEIQKLSASEERVYYQRRLW